MTDYNDGKWHGWNGGECPVHLKSSVSAVWLHVDGDVKIAEGRAGGLAFLGNEYGSIIAFRVVTPYVEPPKPREWWATGHHLHDSRAEADAFLAAVKADNPGMAFAGYDPVLVREVLE